MDDARVKAKSGTRVGVQPISAIVVYHLEVLELLQKRGRLDEADFVALRARQEAIFNALAEDHSTGEKLS